METVLFLPGMMCDERLFSHQFSCLSDLYDVKYLPLSTANTIGEIARFVLDNSPEQFSVVGLSMGGIVAMEILVQAPERVNKVAFLDTNYRAELDSVKANRDLQMAQAQKGNLQSIMIEELKPKYLAQTEHKDAILELCLEMALDLGVDVFVKQSQALQTRVDQTQTLKNLNIPTLVLCGREDRLCDVSRHREMHDLIKGSELVIVENAGHLPTLEQPKTVNDALLKWLE